MYDYYDQDRYECADWLEEVREERAAKRADEAKEWFAEPPACNHVYETVRVCTHCGEALS